VISPGRFPRIRRTLSDKLGRRKLRWIASDVGIPHDGEARTRASEQRGVSAICRLAAGKPAAQTRQVVGHAVFVVAQSQVQRKVPRNLAVVLEVKSPIVFVMVALEKIG